jgi:hypothetical protein
MPEPEKDTPPQQSPLQLAIFNLRLSSPGSHTSPIRREAGFAIDDSWLAIDGQA